MTRPSFATGALSNPEASLNPARPTRRLRRRGRLMSGLLSDVRFGVRVLTWTPGLSAIAVLAFALGIGLTTATFSILGGVVPKGLPLEAPQELVRPKPSSRRPMCRANRRSRFRLGTSTRSPIRNGRHAPRSGPREGQSRVLGAWHVTLFSSAGR